MEPTLSSETSVFILQTPGKFPKEHRLHSKHGESLKTTKIKFDPTILDKYSDAFETNLLSSVSSSPKFENYFQNTFNCGCLGDKANSPSLCHLEKVTL